MSAPTARCRCGKTRVCNYGRLADVYTCAACRRADRESERRRLTPKAVAMYQAGASSHLCAERLGVGAPYVLDLLRRAGVEIRPPRQPAPLQRRSALDVRVPEPEDYAELFPSTDEGLNGGRWVNRSGVQVWKVAS